MNDARKRLQAKVPSIDSLDSVVLPDIQPLEVEVLPPVRDGKLDGSARLDVLTDKALDNIEQILDLPVCGSEGDDIKILNLKATVAGQVLSTQARVDDTRLRRRQVDLLPKILEVLKREQAKLPPRMIEAAE